MTPISEYLKTPIIIIGGPRTGTSFLGRVLAQHPSLVYASEPRTIWRYGNDGKSDMLGLSDARPEVCSAIRSYFENLIEQNPGRRLLEKTPSNALRMGFVDSVFPDCKFIHIIRNGYDAALSISSYWKKQTHGLFYSRIDIKDGILTQRLKEMRLRQVPYYAKEFILRLLPHGNTPRVLWGPRIPGLSEMVKELGVLSASALQWRFCVEAACQYGRQLPGDRYLEIRLEELDWPWIERILGFCELDGSENIRTYYHGYFDRKKSSSRRDRATKQEISDINQWIAPTMHWLGYKIIS